MPFRNWTESDIAAHQARIKEVPVTVHATVIASYAGAPKEKKSLKIVLPFRLPTWNILLAADQWKRKKIRDWIHAAISGLSPAEPGSQILMVSLEKLQSMGLSMQGYYKMIGTNTSQPWLMSKKKATKIKRLSK